MKSALMPNHYPVDMRGLVGWWSYRNTGNVAALGTWKDYSGNSNHGTLNNGVFVNKNGLNTGVAGDYLSANINQDIASSFTISTFCIKNTAGTKVLWSNGQGYADNSTGIDFLVRDTFLQLRLNNGTGAFEEVQYTYSMPIGTRVCFSVVIDFANARKIIYINGIEVSNTALVKTGSVLDNSDTFDIGSAYSSWTGFIDDLMVFNRVLPAGEVKQNNLKI